MNEQMNREALENYFGNLFVLECLKKKTEDVKVNIGNKTWNYSYNFEQTKKNYPNYRIDEPINHFGDWVVFPSVVLLIIWLVISIIVITTDTSTEMLYITIPPILLALAINIVIIIFLNFINKKSISNQTKTYNTKLKEKERICSDYDKVLKKAQSEYDSFNNAATSYMSYLENQIQKYQSQLDEAYSINIIPSEYRDLYGVTYLYDFIHTSRFSTLSEAFYNYSLKMIRDKLDRICSNLQSILVEQRIANINMNEIKRQNDHFLAESRKNSANIALMKDYAQVAATNSAVALELQNEQLAYQKAEFWLKNW